MRLLCTFEFAIFDENLNDILNAQPPGQEYRACGRCLLSQDSNL